MAGKLKIGRAVRQLILVILVKECREMDGFSDLQNGLSLLLPLRLSLLGQERSHDWKVEGRIRTRASSASVDTVHNVSGVKGFGHLQTDCKQKKLSKKVKSIASLPC